MDLGRLNPDCHVTPDLELQVKATEGRGGLRFEKVEARITKKISIVDLKKEDLIRRSEERQSWVVDQEASSQTTISMVTLHCGVRRCTSFKALRAATIRTTVLRRGRVVVHGQLRGKKWFSFKPPLVVPAIALLRRVMALGHIEEGARGRGASPRAQKSQICGSHQYRHVAPL
jgi:hypothetical protein